MAKKKKETDLLEELIFRNQMQNYLCRNEQTELYGNAIEQAQADGVLHEKDRLMQKNSDMILLAREQQKIQRELRKTQRRTDEMVHQISELIKHYNKMEGKMQGLSEKVHSICKEKARQCKKLKKYHLQIQQQKKILRFMGAFLGVNNPTDNLGEIVKKCSHKLESNCRGTKIIDTTFREE